MQHIFTIKPGKNEALIVKDNYSSMPHTLQYTFTENEKKIR